MEFRQYWSIVHRRLWLVALLGATALAVSGYVGVRGTNAYCSNLKLAVNVIPDAGDAPNYRYDRYYYSWLSSEYLADDLTEVMKSTAFADYVWAETGHSIDPGWIASATRARKTHRTIDLAVCGSDQTAVRAVGEAYERVLNTRLTDFFQQLDSRNALVRVINHPTVSRGWSVGSLAAEIALRTLLGLALGVALAFLLDYLDRGVRDRQDAEQVLSLPILAEVPHARRLPGQG